MSCLSVARDPLEAIVALSKKLPWRAVSVPLFLYSGLDTDTLVHNPLIMKDSYLRQFIFGAI